MIKLKQRLEEVGYKYYKEIDDLEIKIVFCNYILMIKKIPSDKFYIRKVNWYNDILETKVCETVDEVLKYIAES